ncbi:MAG: Z1 domain-containing protein [Balneola sp.]
MKNEELQKLHRLAMDNSELALRALRNNDLAKFKELSERAFDYEKKAALGLYNQHIEPSRSVLFRSAAYIALDGADFIEARKLYEYALEGDVPGDLREELEELKTEIDRIQTENEGMIQNTLTFLNNRPKPVSLEDISSDIERSLKSFEEKEINLSYVREYLERQFNIDSERHIILDEGYEPWIHNRKGEVDKRFWERYRKYLLNDQKYAPNTVDKIDDITDDILDHLKDPTTAGDWDKRGMVVGQVQSGKTSNYIGLMSKAADYGYRVIVVLAGLTKDLRSQTQLRTDLGFLGWDTNFDRESPEENSNFGVSKYDSRPQAHYLTTSALDGDFKSTARRSTGTNPKLGHIVLVIKKNPSVLKEFIRWFAKHGEELGDGKRLVKGLPLLLIDDEADNASINISQDNVSTINGLVRSLLSLFQQSAYVGYTATPFANVFIPLTEEEDEISRGLNIQLPEFWKYSGRDLFPKDFILNIFPPSNYIGPKEIFGLEAELSAEPEEAEAGLPLLVEINPAEYESYFPDKHKKDGALPKELPESLNRAIKSFILACAIRRARGQVKAHNSMLVHVTRFVRWQNKVASLINRQLKSWQQQIQYNQGTILLELKELFEKEFQSITEKIIKDERYDDTIIRNIEWFEVETQLKKASAKIRVRAIHGGSTQESLDFDNISSLDYYQYRKSGLSVIAVGGNKLSRGLTLEGLSVSYYLRSSLMYDTLMQMGRWFGYRPGYLDLCRLYTSGELIKWYKYITVASEELRNEFEQMKSNRKSPRNFGIKVRRHPDVLKITATNKMRSGHEMELTFSDKLRETWCFRRDQRILESNYKHTYNFINSLEFPKSKNGQKFVWQDDNNWQKVLDFLKGYEADNRIEHQKIIEYISEQAKGNFLTNWTIVLISNDRNQRSDLFQIQGESVSVGLTMRSDSRKGEGNYYEIAKSHIIDPKHEYIDFKVEEEAFKEALNMTVKDWRESERINKKPDSPTVPTGKNIRAKRPPQNGLLLIYPLDPKPQGWEESDIETPIIGYAISFPKNEDDKKLKYQVNEVFMDEFDYDLEEFEESDNDE